MTLDTPEKALPELHGRLESWFGELRLELSRAQQGERDPEVVHQIRVLVRRLRSAFKIVSAAVDGKVKGLKPLDRALKELADASGPVRDADVFEEHLLDLKESPEATAPGWSEAIGLLIEELNAAREAGRAALNAVHAREDVAAQLARGPELLARLAAVAPPPSGLAPQIATRLAELEQHVQQARLANDPDEWHEVRIAIKRVRYATELMAGKESPLLEGFAKMQSMLGKAHDHRVWEERARKLHDSIELQPQELIARVGLNAIALREAESAAGYEQRFSSECDAAIGPDLRAQLLASVGAGALVATDVQGS